MDLDDASGKRKVPNVQARSAMLTGALIVGMCLGVIVSEKLYLITQEADLPEGAVAAVRSRKLEVQASAGTAVRRSTGKPRSELEEILQRVAPQGEVMIAISNMNLIHEQSLVMWLEVCGSPRGCVQQRHGQSQVCWHCMIVWQTIFIPSATC